MNVPFFSFFRLNNAEKNRTDASMDQVAASRSIATSSA